MFQKIMLGLLNTLYHSCWNKGPKIDIVIILGGCETKFGSKLIWSFLSLGLPVIHIDLFRNENFDLLPEYQFYPLCSFENARQEAFIFQKLYTIRGKSVTLINNFQYGISQLFCSKTNQKLITLQQCTLVNLILVMKITKFFLKKIVSVKNNFSIVNISHQLTLELPSLANNYMFSKAALNQYVDSLFSELHSLKRGDMDVKCSILYLPIILDFQLWEEWSDHINDEIIKYVIQGRTGVIKLEPIKYDYWKLRNIQNIMHQNI
ncbi:uncharacterized protein NDAI_0B03100 [Naumovozyma dairenensis CBS 421]|uniref:Ketoreductase (KR) domain-containing protein n=1 Tax=Naumovozyma dairenensis (strain ATCC 10597 / BCRC 20456 / CBS 421 / NBRC 0211 / NRRL Y-12639) TaxID=1071378 RepID=G0W6D4_NAUDC|nr:hypothetical protein NDAI_0B03100 [Naumovozyma dairenensis CBS 421]CCD23345.1 hypothetical protein NDAI_0B03100 [Naumovozyma dairenensis CBS 421]